MIVVSHVLSWPHVRRRHVRGSVGRRRFFISSQSGPHAASPPQLSLLWLRCTYISAPHVVNVVDAVVPKISALVGGSVEGTNMEIYKDVPYGHIQRLS